ncbi:excinuclease ABC subunit UvrA [Spiroplasma endosymbiont of Aspidapion aeneum]|uniref:excinuclease ABC subunit UvrA n=1 Tax=Spiroplasma endosymbiont of Aspidapion aeneum TaxID=3066276 RepID=UPI00313EA093
MENKEIKIYGAREHNLKNINVSIPKNSLTVITGLSGSGKSSLAFNTLYAEGERRYVESLSSFTRQFFKTKEKPDVDDIEGLSPAIAIDQKGQSHNPRSTVATITEIHDYLRVLFANKGVPFCINGHGPITKDSVNGVMDSIFKELKDKESFYITGPIVRNYDKNLDNIIANVKEDGYVRVLINNKVFLLDDEIKFEKNTKYDIDVLISRYSYDVSIDISEGLTIAVESALKYTNGLVRLIKPELNESILYSTRNACKECNFVIPDIDATLFSFNQKKGACSSCAGLGYRLEAVEELLVPDQSLSINDGAIVYYKNRIDDTSREYQILKALCEYYKISMNLPYSKLSKKDKQYLLKGSDERIAVNLRSVNNIETNKKDYIEGIATLIERRYIETSSSDARNYYSTFMLQRTCKECKGQRLNDFALSVKVANNSIADIVAMSIEKCIEFFINLNITKKEDKVNNLILNKIIDKLIFIQQIGLEYITLDRQTSTLSGGESQRIRLARQLGTKLTGVLYVLDEPSIGLHQKDNKKLIETLKKLRDFGNTVVVVEHDIETIEAADYVIDIGPSPGLAGGYLVACGTPDEIKLNDKSITGKYLSGKNKIMLPTIRKKSNSVLRIFGAKENNLKNIDISIPTDSLVSITGVSGGGKSTLLEDIIFKGINQIKGFKTTNVGKFEKILGSELIDKVIFVSQDPIGKTPRSIPATYVGVFDDIRELYSMAPESKIRGYTRGRFSFNKPGGRCENCWGEGEIRVDMQFLGSVIIDCEVCNGKRYNELTLSIKYKNKSIYDVLEMTFTEAFDFFKNSPKISSKLETVIEVGLGYLKLGQNAATLSGGEAQRIKLSTFLLKKTKGKNLFLFDEPTTGLHIDDVNRLIGVLNKLIENRNGVVVIEHNLDFIKVSDFIIDMGLDGGVKGGYIVATGTPEDVSKNINSYTGKFLKDYL